MSRFHHLAHLLDITVKVGKYVHRGELIGHCGSSGASTGPHLHYEIMRGRPRSWRQYVRGMRKDQVSQFYLNPLPFIRDAIPMAHSLPKVGWSYLQVVMEKNGRHYYHPGIDVNGLNDYGVEVKAPCNGRVVFLEDAPAWHDNFSLLRQRMNGGWGRHIFIEQDEANPGIVVKV